VNFNGVDVRVLLTSFQKSYKGFKGKFFKIRCNDNDPTLLDGFPLYWTEEPEFQKPKRLEDLSQREQEVCLFLSNLKVVFDTAILIKHEYCPRVLRHTLVSPFPLLPLMIYCMCVFVEFSFVFNADNMLRLNKKDLAVMAKKMKAASHSSLTKELKMKEVVAVAASDDEDMFLGSVFK